MQAFQAKIRLEFEENVEAGCTSRLVIQKCSQLVGNSVFTYDIPCSTSGHCCVYMTKFSYQIQIAECPSGLMQVPQFLFSKTD